MSKVQAAVNTLRYEIIWTLNQFLSELGVLHVSYNVYLMICNLRFTSYFLFISSYLIINKVHFSNNNKSQNNGSPQGPSFIDI